MINTFGWQVRVIQALAVVGIVLAFYMLLFHQGVLYLNCSTEGAFNCDEVSGPYAAYSKFFGIPVALLGFIGYVGIFGVVWAGEWLPLLQGYVPRLLLLLTGVALLFTAYLTYLEAFVIGAWCQYCLYSAGLVVIMFGLSVWSNFGRTAAT